jgi:hypothetical protein
LFPREVPELPYDFSLIRSLSDALKSVGGYSHRFETHTKRMHGITLRRMEILNDVLNHALANVPALNETHTLRPISEAVIELMDLELQSIEAMITMHESMEEMAEEIKEKLHE